MSLFALTSACQSDGAGADPTRGDIDGASTSGDGGGGDSADATPDPDAPPRLDGVGDVADPDADDPDALGSDTTSDTLPQDIADTSGAPAGSVCTSDDICASGWCVPSAVGQVCVDVCVDQCDAGQACIPAAESGTDPVFLCVPFEVPPGPDTVGGDTPDASDSTDPADIIEPGDVPPDDSTLPTDDVIVDDAEIGPDVPPDDTIGSDGDSDGDGIPDDEDNLPCVAIYLIVYNNEVSSASLILNGAEVVASNAFPTTEPITVVINPTTGENTLELGGKLTGSPTDTLTVVIADSEGRIFFATVILREPGKPEAQVYTFNIDVTCP